jgi:hypothetical protein
MVLPLLSGVVSHALRFSKHKTPQVNGALAAASRAFSAPAPEVDLKSVLAGKIPHEQVSLGSVLNRL